MNSDSQSILFYDGDCGLCNRSVRFLMKRDRPSRLRFAPLQGETARDRLEPELRESLSTIVYHRADASMFIRSDAVLHALIDIRSGWRFLARAALVVPRAWRDGVYNQVSKNRHRFFPKNDCPLPTEEERGRLLP